MSAPETTSKQPRVSKADWLDAGLRTIATKGVDGVRVEQLARSLNVAKSGFYWHFADRNDYLGQLLEHWDGVSTHSVHSDARVVSGAPRRRLLRIMQLVEAGDLPSYDIALHAWAREDARARAIDQRTVDRSV